jgi:predicted transcriptional regulator
MADGELTLKLDDETARRLQAAADAAGRPVGAYAAELISEGLPLDDDWAEDVRIAEEVDRTGVFYTLEETMAHFDAALEAHLAKKR